jgi:O-antigen/teichoic acid export membrane protein
MHETKRIFSGFIANVYSQGVTVFSQIVLVPFFISNWGVQQYGDWLILIALPMYISLSDMGFSSSAANEMCMLAGKRRDKEVLTTFVSSWYLSISLASVLSIILFLIFLLLQYTGTYKFTSITPDHARLGFILYLVYMFMTVLCASIAAVYKYAQKYSLNIYINNTTRLFEAISTIILLIAKQDLITVIAWMIAIRAIGLFSLIAVAKRIVPFFTLKLADFSLNKIKDLTGSSLHFSIFSTAVNLFPQAFLIALGSTASSQVVVVYSMVKTLSRFGFQILNSYNSSLSVEISHLNGKKSWDKIFSLIDKSFLYFFSFSILYISIGVYSVDYIFKLWSGMHMQVDPALFLLVSATSLTQSIWMLLFSVFSSSNNHAKASKLYAVISFLYLVAVFAMMGPGDLNNFLLLGLLMEVIMLAFLLQDYRKYKIARYCETC